MVGSLLRPKVLKDAREKKAAGQMSADDLRGIEDAEITKIIKQQENIGLRAVTDGEFRRAWWHYDFIGQLDGVKMVPVDQGIQFAGVQTKAEAPRIVGRIDYSTHPFIDHFTFLAAQTRNMPKMTIPSPSMLHYRGGRKMMNMPAFIPIWPSSTRMSARPTPRPSQAYYAKAGCRYLQLDDISFAYLCDPEQRADARRSAAMTL